MAEIIGSTSPAIAFSSPTSIHDDSAIDVWLLDLSEFNKPLAYDQILSPAEINRAQRFTRRQHNFLTTRVFLRRVLSLYTQQTAAALAFGQTPEGKPYLLNTNLHFNLSHTAHYAALAVSHKGAVGADIETIQPRNFLMIAERYFHPSETQQLRVCKDAERPELFFKLWTLKEAFLKALGGGISTGLDKAIFTFAESDIHAEVAESLGVNTCQWQFEHAQLNTHTVIAIAHQIAEQSNTKCRWFDGNHLLQAS